MIDPKPTASHFINGAYVEDIAGSVINVVYPATGEVIARVHGATPAILEAALAAAKAAQPAWAALTGLCWYWRLELSYSNCRLESCSGSGLWQCHGL